MSTNAAAFTQGNYQVKNAAQITLFNIVSVSPKNGNFYIFEEAEKEYGIETFPSPTDFE